MQKSISMTRILGIESKDRLKLTTKIERELLHAIKTNTLDIADTLNVALEKYLRERDLL